MKKKIILVAVCLFAFLILASASYGWAPCSKPLFQGRPDQESLKHNWEVRQLNPTVQQVHKELTSRRVGLHPDQEVELSRLRNTGLPEGNSSTYKTKSVEKGK